MKRNLWEFMVLCMVLFVSSAATAAPHYLLTSECSFATVSVDGSKVTLRFRNCDREDLERMLPKAKKAPLGKKFVVRGTSGRYLAAVAGIMGQDTFPFVMLLNENGAVEYIDVVKGIRDGQNFKVNGTLSGIKKVIGFQCAVFDEDGSGDVTILALHADGSRTDLADKMPH